MRDRTAGESHEQTIEAPAEDVWRFIVDPGALSGWFAADAWLEPEVGGLVDFRFLDGTRRRGVVVDVDLHRELTWKWRSLQGAGFAMRIGEPSTVTIRLDRVDGGTRVRITERPGSDRAEIVA